MGLFGWMRQVSAVIRLGLRTLPLRIGASSVVVIGVAGVVAVFVGVLSIAEGFKKTMEVSGSPDTAVVTRSGADSEMTSILTRDDVRLIQDSPGILRTEDGALASAELFVIVDLPKRSSGTVANVPLRGVQPRGFKVRKDVRIVAGRSFEPGRNEMVVGVGAARQFSGLEVGSVHRWGRNEWHVVGHFSAGGGIVESELWCDVGVLQPAYQRGTTFQAVYAKLDSADAFTQFKDALTTNPQLNVKVQRETEFYAEQSTLLYAIIVRLGILIAALMGIGAVFSALNTMYTAVAARTREIATLRALGFGGGPVVLSVLVESLLLALVGGLLGGGLAYVAFNGYQTATINWQSFSQVAFAFAVTPPLLVRATALALLIGLLGGLFPGVRAARASVSAALREL